MKFLNIQLNTNASLVPISDGHGNKQGEYKQCLLQTLLIVDIVMELENASVMNVKSCNLARHLVVMVITPYVVFVEELARFPLLLQM